MKTATAFKLREQEEKAKIEEAKRKEEEERKKFEQELISGCAEQMMLDLAEEAIESNDQGIRMPIRTSSAPFYKRNKRRKQGEYKGVARLRTIKNMDFRRQDSYLKPVKDKNGNIKKSSETGEIEYEVKKTGVFKPLDKRTLAYYAKNGGNKDFFSDINCSAADRNCPKKIITISSYREYDDSKAINKYDDNQNYLYDVSDEIMDYNHVCDLEDIFYDKDDEIKALEAKLKQLQIENNKNWNAYCEAREKYYQMYGDPFAEESDEDEEETT